MSDMLHITDHTLPPQGEAGAVVVSHGVNKGYGAAIRSCFNYAKGDGFEAMIILDGDGQHDTIVYSGFYQSDENRQSRRCDWFALSGTK